MHGYFFSDKPPKLETNMYIEPQFFFTKISYMEEKQFFMKNGLRNVFINDGSFMNIHDFNLIYVCSVKFLAYNKLIATIRELLKKNTVPVPEVCMPNIILKNMFNVMSEKI